MTTTRGSLPRCLAVWTVVTALAAGAAAWLAPVAASLPAAAGGRSETDFAVALVALCAAVGLVALAWLWVLTGLVVTAALRGRTHRVRAVPPVVRRAVLAACGVALTGGLAAAPATATPGHPHQDLGPQAAMTRLPLPERAVAAPTASPAASPAGMVVVRPGDTLWAIARRSLPAHATDADIDARWHRIHAANRDVIGPDPDLIRPAQRLRIPT